MPRLFTVPNMIATLTLCVVSINSTVAAAHPTAILRARAPSPVVEVQLTRSGAFAHPDESLVVGMTVLDRQIIDVDGDGDSDQLAFVDVGDRVFTPLERSLVGRGAVVFFNDQGSWHGQTIASVSSRAIESGYNWAEAPALVGGRTPVLRVLYSGVHAGRFAQAEYAVRFDRNAIRPLSSHPHNSKR